MSFVAFRKQRHFLLAACKALCLFVPNCFSSITCYFSLCVCTFQQSSSKSPSSFSPQDITLSYVLGNQQFFTFFKLCLHITLLPLTHHYYKLHSFCLFACFFSPFAVTRSVLIFPDRALQRNCLNLGHISSKEDSFSSTGEINKHLDKE